jgi:hypothetical protein
VSAIGWENHKARLDGTLGVGSIGFAAGGLCLVLEHRGAAAL